MMYGMRKTTVYLPDELKARIEARARAEGRSEAELIRSALVAFTAGDRPRPHLPLFASGRGGLAEHVDEALRGFGRR